MDTQNNNNSKETEMFSLSAENFDNDKFWKWAEGEVKKGNKVIVSEYTAPKDWVCIWSKNMQDGMNSDSTKRKIEKIFVHKSQKQTIKI